MKKKNKDDYEISFENLGEPSNPTTEEWVGIISFSLVSFLTLNLQLALLTLILTTADFILIKKLILFLKRGRFK